MCHKSLFMPPPLPTQGEEGISGACSQSAAWMFWDQASGTAERDEKYHQRKRHTISPSSKTFHTYHLQQNLEMNCKSLSVPGSAPYSPCTQSRWIPALPWLLSSDRDLWLSSALPVFWHFAAETESSDAHVPFYNNLQKKEKSSGEYNFNFSHTTLLSGHLIMDYASINKALSSLYYSQWTVA